MGVVEELRKVCSPEKAEIYQRFFKTGKGEYGEGDVFLGVTVPETRRVAKRYVSLPLLKIKSLLLHKVHECRLAAILILVEKYAKAEKKEREEIFEFYWRNAEKVNNWDLVDLSADKIVGQHLLDKNIVLLRKLATSDNLWERRIAIIATFQFIKNNKFNETIEISEILLNDNHDLIHKAVGWMLREVGKKDQKVEEKFLKKYHKTMPRTMLRYAIERFDEDKRKFYMKK